MPCLPCLARRRPLTAIVLTTAWLLSAHPATVATPRLAASALRQIDALASIHQGKTAVQRKLDARLYLGLLHQRGDERLEPLTAFRFVRPDSEGRVTVEIALADAGGIKDVLDALSRHGAPVASVSAAHRVITARLRFDDLEPLAALPAVRAVRRHVAGVTIKVNTSEGDVTHLAMQARNFFAATGAGVKVCVLSDGVDSLAAVQATGDLPATVEVLAGQAGSGNEGTAMLEVVHDLAPEATLAFATATTSQAQFAQNILDLAATGCRVMVDAVSYPDESPFQDGPIAQAVNTVTAAGVLYFSAAGDDGNQTDSTSSTWEGDFLANGEVPALAGGGVAHDFGDGGQSIQVLEHTDSVVLTWAEHSDLSVGQASTDFDVYILNAALTSVFDASTDVQDGVGGNDFPIEIAGQAFAGERIVVTRFSAGSTSSAPMFNLLALRGRLDPTLATSGAIAGMPPRPTPSASRRRLRPPRGRSPTRLRPPASARRSRRTARDGCSSIRTEARSRLATVRAPAVSSGRSRTSLPPPVSARRLRVSTRSEARPRRRRMRRRLRR